MSKIKTAKSMRKPPPIVGKSKSSEDDVQLEVELVWCVQQLENALSSGKLSQKLADDTAKNLRTLKSNTAPLIKKRQTMKAALGDYRAKMKEEEKKMALATKQIKFTTSADANKKFNFVKKSAILTTGKDFRFDFNVAKSDENHDEINARASQTPEPKYVVANKNLDLTGGEGFKFNFVIEPESEDFNLNELSIKN